MKKVLKSILALLAITSIPAYAADPIPRLIVGLTIDQLRSDYLETFSALYGERGIKRLMKEGRVYKNASYNFTHPDRASSVAALYTGTSPSVNGIISELYLDISSLRPKNCVEDPAFMGFYTEEATSPSQLLTSTLADELKVATRGRGMVYAIAPYREAAIFGAGHAGNGAFWINDETGKWSGTTYYEDFPWWVSRYNDQKAIDSRLGNITWTPMLPVSRYKYLTANWEQDNFKHKFDDSKNRKYRKFKTSPFVNDEVNSLVEDFLESTPLGQDEHPDLLALTYYAGSYENKSTLEYALEMQDTYVRLDKSIEKLFELLDKKVGLNNVLLFITSTGYSDNDGPDLNRYRIPGGEFHLNRCATLLNMYLMAIYGEGQYVEAYYDQQIYINHRLIETKQLSLNDVLNKAADFLVQFSGVKEVYSSYRLLLGSWTPEIEKIRNSYHRKRSGDLFIEVLPGWTIVDEVSLNNKVARKANIPLPLIFFGGNIKSDIISTPVTLDHLAATVAGILKIRGPNGCSALPLFDISK